tara:strand:+ start:480 stop:905 length:426 start_codon:yes stop_codon:yes gene_type:complete
MLWYTHIAFALLLGEFFSFNLIEYLILIFACLLPDIDHPDSKLGYRIKPISNLIKLIFGHRGVMHSVWVLFLFSYLVYLFSEYYLAFFIGYFSHIFIDGFTKAGINYLNPIGKVKLNGFIRVGGLYEYVLFILLVLLIWII